MSRGRGSPVYLEIATLAPCFQPKYLLDRQELCSCVCETQEWLYEIRKGHQSLGVSRNGVNVNSG